MVSWRYTDMFIIITVIIIIIIRDVMDCAKITSIAYGFFLFQIDWILMPLQICRSHTWFRSAKLKNNVMVFKLQGHVLALWKCFNAEKIPPTFLCLFIISYCLL